VVTYLERQHSWDETGQDIPFTPQIGGMSFFCWLSFKTCLFDLPCNGSADEEWDWELHFKTVVKRFPYQRAFTRHKNARFERRGCSTAVNLRHTSEPKVRLQLLLPIASVTSLLNTRRSYSKMAILWRKPSLRQQIAFLKTNNKTQSVKDIKKYNSSTTLLQGNVREWLCTVCGGATEEGYRCVWVLLAPIWRDDWYGGCGTIMFSSGYFWRHERQGRATYQFVIMRAHQRWGYF